MVDGRVYASDDGWSTVYLITPAGKELVEDREEASMAKFVFLHSH